MRCDLACNSKSATRVKGWAAAILGVLILALSVSSASAQTGLVFTDSGQALGADRTRSVAAGDFDGDGDIDAFTAYQGSASRMWLNNAAGTLTPTAQLFENLEARCAAAGDLDGDGDLDLFLVNYGEPNVVYLNAGAASFIAIAQPPSTAPAWWTSLGDLDGDGDLDAFVVNRDATNRVWLNNGAGVLTVTAQTMVRDASQSVAALADVDHDGDLDAVVANYNEPNRVWLNNGNAFFTDSGHALGVYRTTGVALGDFNGDGHLDAYMGVYGSQPDRVWLGDGLGNFTDTGQALGADSTVEVATADIDSDGDLDVFATNANGANRMWLNNGFGQFTDSGQAIGNSSSLSVGLADFTGDGDVDALVGNNDQADRLWINITLHPPTIVPEPAWTGGTANTIYWGSVVRATTYTIQRNETPDFFGAVSASVPAAQLSHTFASLTAGQTYYYRVRTENANWISAWSDVTPSTQDITPPVVAVDALLTNDTTPLVTGTYNDPFGEVATVVLVVNGVTYATPTLAGGVWSAQLGALSDGTYNVAATATDVAGNSAQDATTGELRIDTVGPGVTVNKAADQLEITSGTIRFNVVFAEAVTGFEFTDVVFATGDGMATGMTGAVTGATTTYQIEVTNVTTDGFVIATIPPGAAVDAAGNGNAASMSTDHSVTYDSTPPEFFAIAADPSWAQTGTPVAITFRSSEKLRSNPTVQINGHPAAFGGSADLGNGQFSYSYSYTVLGADPVGGATIVVAGVDLAGNAGSTASTTALAKRSLFVDASVAASGTGTSWAAAKKTIGEALAIASAGDQVWVARGTYLESITIPSQVGVFGGFASGETRREDRNPAANRTIIDASTANAGAPAAHVVVLASVTSVTLDNFTITGGAANGAGDSALGGGVFASGVTDSLISNCIVRGNSATNGAGLYLSASASLRVEACVIGGNVASNLGGGLFIGTGSVPAIVDTVISGNRSGSNGAGIYVEETGSFTMTNSILTGNRSENDGGAMYLYAAAPVAEAPSVVNSTISGNVALNGGGVFAVNKDIDFVNTIFENNTNFAVYEANDDADATVGFCLFNSNPDGDFWDDGTTDFTGNVNGIAPAGSGVNAVYGSAAFVMSGAQAVGGTWTAVAYDAAQNLTALTDAATAFVPNALVGRTIRPYEGESFEAVIASNDATAIYVQGNATAAPISAGVGIAYVLADYRLGVGSAAINTGTAAGAPAVDIDGNARPTGAGFDIGAYEAQPDIDVAVSANPLNFGNREVGAGPTAPAEDVTVTNRGSLPLAFTGAGVALIGPNASEFTLTGAIATTDMAGGEVRTMQIAFDPATRGPKQAALVFTTNDSDESTVTINLIGHAPTDAPTLAAEPLLTGGTQNTISWTPVDGAVAYQAQVDIWFDFRLATAATVLSPSVSLTFGSLGENLYHYRVRAIDAWGVASAWSDVEVSTQDSTLPVVSLTSILTSDTTPILSGTASDGNGVTTLTLTVDGMPCTVTLPGDGTWTAEVPLLGTDGTYDAITRAVDGAGNVAVDTWLVAIALDTTPPVLTLDATPTISTTPQLSGTVNDASGVALLEVWVDDGTANGTTYTATVTGTDWTADVTTPLPGSGLYDVNLKAVDILGLTASLYTTNGLSVDTTQPTATLTVAVGQADPTSSTILFDVFFSEPIVGLSFDDFAFTGTAGDLSGSVSGSGTTYALSVTGVGDDGTVAPELPADAVNDLAGNGNLLSTSTASVVYDGTGPAFSNLAASNGTPIVAGTIITLTFTVSEALASNPSVTFNGNSASFDTSTDNGDGTFDYSYLYTVLPSDPAGAFVIEITGRDMAGNVGTLTDSTRVARSALYVDDSVAASSDGSSWAQAYKTIPEAIDAATTGSTIFVAGGTYYTSVTMKSGLALYGGFDATDSVIENRDFEANPTIIDGTSFASVVLVENVTTVTLDGLTLQGGVGGLDAYGGGLKATSATLLTIANVKFVGNATQGYGGAFSAQNVTSLTLSDCTFEGNQSRFGGGAFIQDSTAQIENCEFIGNKATNAGPGGGLYLISSQADVAGCVFAANSADGNGGALVTDSSTLTLTDSVLSGNFGAKGGAVDILGVEPVQIVNSTISGNTAAQQGGGVYVSGNAAPQIVNSTISANAAAAGGGVYLNTDATAVLTNSILENNSNWALYNASAVLDVTLTNNLFSNPVDFMDNGIPRSGAVAINAASAVSIGNVDGDPLFAMTGATGLSGTWTGVTLAATFTILEDSAAAFTPDALVGRLVEFDSPALAQAVITANTATAITVRHNLGSVPYTGGRAIGDAYRIVDYRLGASSPAIDRGTDATAAYPATAHDIDSNARPYDVAATGANGTGTEFDIGAYESQANVLVVPSDAIDFGTRPLWLGPTDPEAVTVTNAGTVALGFVPPSIQIVGPHASEFLIASAAPTGPLGMDRTFTIQIVFSPLSPGSKLATLVITTDDADEGEIRIALSGYTPPRPIAPSLTAEPALTAGTTNAIFWGAALRAISYTVECAESDAFAPVLQTQTVFAPTAQATFTGLANGTTYYYRARSNDAYGSVSPWSNIVSSTQDATAPQVTVEQNPAQVDPTNTPPILFVVAFDSDVTGFDETDVTFTGTAVVTGHTVTPVTASEYALSVTALGGSGTVVPTIPAGAALDGAGNPSAASTGVDNSVTYDVAGPVVSNLVASPREAPAGSHVEVSFEMDEALAANPVVSINSAPADPIAGTFLGSVDNLYTYEFVVSPVWNAGPVSISITATDLLGNVGVMPVDTTAFTKIIPVLVDADATGLNDGSTWVDAYQSFGDLIADLGAFPSGYQVWVAEGVYNEQILIDQSSVSIYGGFDGSEALLTDRDLRDNPTIIDGAGIPGSVVTLDGVDSVVIDGFTITGGSAYSSGAENGAGVFITNNSGAVTTVTLANCRIAGNKAMQTEFGPNTPIGGGGVYVYGGRVELVNCIVAANEVVGWMPTTAVGTGGAGVYLDGAASAAILSCTIADNLVSDFDATDATSVEILAGGGVFLGAGVEARIENSIFAGNEGYALYFENDTATASLDTCLFYNNPDGDWYLQGMAAGTTGAPTAQANLPGAVDCALGDPSFVDYPTLTGLTMSTAFNAPNTEVTVIWGAFTTGALVGKIVQIGQVAPVFRPIISNTATTIVIPGNHAAATWFQILDYDLSFAGDSAAIDAGIAVVDSTPPVNRAAKDFYGYDRPIDINGIGQDDTGTEYDIGAYEVRPFAGGLAETWIPDANLTTMGIVQPAPAARSQTWGAGWDVTDLTPDGNAYFGRWYRADENGKMFTIPYDGGGGLTNPVFEAKFGLRSTAGSAATCPGYRITYVNGAYSHMGVMTVNTPNASAEAIHAPHLGNDFEARVYWATPTETVNDSYVTHPEAQYLPYFSDGRDYSIIFELIHIDDADTGLLTAESFEVRAFEEPAATGPAKVWSAATSETFADWTSDIYGDPFNEGTATIAGDGSYLRLSALDQVNWGYPVTYVKATPEHSATDPSLTADTLWRCTVDVSSQDVNRSPVFRVALFGIDSTATPGDPFMRGTYWTDIYGASGTYIKRPGERQPGQLSPGVPRTAADGGSTIRMYRWTHSVNSPAQNADFVIPQIDAYSTGQYGLHLGNTYWPDDTGYLEFTRVAIEALDAPPAP